MNASNFAISPCAVVSTLGAKPSPDALSTRDIEVVQTRVISPEATTNNGAMILMSLTKSLSPHKSRARAGAQVGRVPENTKQLSKFARTEKIYLQMMPKLFANSPNAAFSILQIHPNTSKYVLKQSCELDTKITANGSWNSLFTHVDTFRGFSKDVWTTWCQSLLSETLRQPRAVLAVDALLSGPLLAVSMDVFRDEVQHRSFRDEVQHWSFRDEVQKRYHFMRSQNWAWRLAIGRSFFLW